MGPSFSTEAGAHLVAETGMPNNELLRTKRLVKNSIVPVDATPFRQWYEGHYGDEIGKKKKSSKAPKKEEGEDEETKKSSHVLRKLKDRQATRTLDPQLDDQFATGRLYACISSRPGQCGRCDGYILEGKELEFYSRQLAKKKSAKK